MHTHLVGIGGSGLSAIARVLLERGERVSGSDMSDSPFLDPLRDAGVEVMAGHRAENIRGAARIVVSSAIPDSNPEVAAARAAGIPVFKRNEFFGPLTEGKRTVAVAGTHGKTTTTGAIAFLLAQGGLDPTFIVGGALADFAGANARAGQGEHFVVEADEYDRAFLGLSPWLAVVTNLEHDHPDCYPALEDLFGAFAEFLARVRPDGRVIACADSEGAMRVARAFAEQAGAGALITYALEADADWRAVDLQAQAGGGTAFAVVRGGERLGEVRLRLPGRHNVANALAALCAAECCGVPFPRAAELVGRFHGAERRFEIKGEAGGIAVVDDYAHHPSEIRATLAAARQRFPRRRIWALWQPHTYSRTRALADEFACAFTDADRLVVLPVYRAREPFDETFSLEELVGRFSGKEAYMIQSLDDAVAVLDRELTAGDALITLSAGDANRVGEELLRRLRRRELRAVRSSGAVDLPLPALREKFGERLREADLLARYTSARLGGIADALLEVNDAGQLQEAAEWLWERGLPYLILGSGSNLLIADEGCREVVILNRAKRIEFRPNAAEGGLAGSVWAESGASIGAIARQAAQFGWTGMEWAATVPGTVGGAVVGNAGAFGGDTAASLRMADILQRTESGARPAGSRSVRQTVDAAALEFGYRASRLKRLPGRAVVLAAEFTLQRCEPAEAVARIGEFVARRKTTQPQGASLGSMFKNPPGDFAGRLIEAAGLKGYRMGGAEISNQHANFFLNTGDARAQDVFALMALARRTVLEKFGVELEPEIVLAGDWPDQP